VALLAVVLSITDAIVIAAYDIDLVWRVLQLPVVLSAWVAVFAWARRRWTLAGACLLITLGGLWGYLYIPPLVALVLAVVAFRRAARARPSVPESES
jgi:hypothetical protein